MQLLNTMMGILNIFHIKVYKTYYPFVLKMKHSQQISHSCLCVTAVVSSDD